MTNTVATPETATPAATHAGPPRRRLPDERPSITHRFSIAGHEGYITVGLYPDGTPGEIFISMNKAGSTISGLMDTIAVSVSTGLQHGVPLAFFVGKFSHVRFEPSGWTGNQQLPYAKSIMDYLFRWLGKRFLGHTDPNEAGHTTELRCAAVFGMRWFNDPQRLLLQVRELRRDQRLFVTRCGRGESSTAAAYPSIRISNF